ncbi:hypothetical protein [Streptomyces cyaneofuscatus]|uniref:DNA-binding protein WhiA n=1 Tax=Streptomyces cyaneofuscatus TaxID=66883 RepID=A0ABZ1EW73_9ACTN|nr:hypothetical protein [Streptomyces cyaneofuscatus]WSB08378.1 hypothetical protein OG849_14485 [Streptomyces cyaneofuscatus]WSD48089.1 hypothetical protein OG857_20920 [Streptomyces cyaneofuscatus]
MTAMTATASPAGAAAELRTALTEAGLPVGATGTDDYVQLGTLRASDARQLARLIRTGTKRTLKAARALREICEAYGIDLPELRVRQGRITLGACRVDDAVRLARLLGASSPGPDAPDADAVRDLLAEAFSAATGGGTLDVSVREEASGVVDLGALDARTARRLIGALRF